MLRQRSNKRFLCQEALDCYQDGLEFEAEIVDVSGGGLRIACHKDLCLGSELVIQPKNEDRGKFPIRTIVRWSQKGLFREYGLEFQKDIRHRGPRWVARLFPNDWSPEEMESRRGESRKDVCLPVFSDDFTEGHTVDLSPRGARLRLKRKLKNSEPLMLCLPWALLEISPKVVRQQRVSGAWECAVHFPDAALSSQEAIREFLQQDA